MTATARSRPGRPRSNGSAPEVDPREEILRHAAALFSAKGIGATRMSEIAASVGISTPAIYYHFDNRDAIVGALLGYVVEESAAYATAASRRRGPSAERLRSLVAQHIERLTAGPYDLWFVAGMSATEGRAFPTVHRRADQWRKSVARLVRAGIDAGDFHPVDIELAVAAVSGLVYGAMKLRHDGGTVHPDEVARLAVSCLSCA
jgi:AcrR family transcriptional regulator